MMKRTFGEKTFDAFNVILLTLLGMMAVIPIVHVVAGSFSSPNALIHNKVSLWPVNFTLDNYRLVMQTPEFWHAFRMTILVVVIGTFVNMVFTITTAYPLSKVFLRGRRFILMAIVFTMIFHAPLIPVYLVVKAFGMLNTIWSIIIPGAIGAFNLILCITFFRSLPEELYDAAKVDGMNEYRMIGTIVIPLSKPIMVTLLLFYAVGNWNNYMGPLMFIYDRNLQTLPIYLYRLISQGSSNDFASAATMESSLKILPEALEMAIIVLSTLPIVILYPFLQKHFIAGTMLGSVKE